MLRPIRLIIVLLSFSFGASASVVTDTVAEQNLALINNQLHELTAEMKILNAKLKAASTPDENKCFWSNETFTTGAIHSFAPPGSDKEILYVCKSSNGRASWAQVKAADHECQHISCMSLRDGS